MISKSSTEEQIVKKFGDFNAEDQIGVKLLENSIHFLNSDITEENVNECIKWITFENLDTKQEKILTLYINSVGGDLYQAFGLIDIMKRSEHPIRTIGVGTVMSAAFLIFAAGTKGQRYIGANTGIMCHQYTDGIEGKHHDIQAQMKEGKKCNDQMLEILVEATGKSASVVKKKLLPPSDVFMTAQEMIDIGAADHLL